MIDNIRCIHVLLLYTKNDKDVKRMAVWMDCWPCNLLQNLQLQWLLRYHNIAASSLSKRSHLSSVACQTN